MYLIVGLGNPGAQYAQTRHNIGFMAADRLAARHGLGPARHKFHAEVCEGTVVGRRCFLLRPLTYMNRSGLAVGEAIGFYKCEPNRQLLVVVDDVALPFGRLRLRASGSPGGHKGLADIERYLGTPHYARLRIGIDGPGRIPQVEYVLNRFSREERGELEHILNNACDAIESWLTEGIEQAMNRYNQ